MNAIESAEKNDALAPAGSIAGLLLGQMPRLTPPDPSALRPVMLLNLDAATIHQTRQPYTASNILPASATRQVEIARIMMSAPKGAEFKQNDFQKIGVAASDAARALAGMEQRGLVVARAEEVGEATIHWFAFNPRWAILKLPPPNAAALKRAELAASEVAEAAEIRFARLKRLSAQPRRSAPITQEAATCSM